MWKKTPFLVLGVLLLTQLVDSAATKDKDTSSSTSSEEIIYVTPRELLLFNMIVSFSEFADQTLVKELYFVKKVLEDENIVNADTSTMKDFRQNLKNLIREIEEVPKLHQYGHRVKEKEFLLLFTTSSGKANMLVKFVDMLKDLDTIKPATDEDQIIQQALLQSGAKKVEEEINDMFSVFSRLFVAAIEKYTNKLPAEEKINEEKMVKWCNYFKTEKDLGKKIEMLENFKLLYKRQNVDSDE